MGKIRKKKLLISETDGEVKEEGDILMENLVDANTNVVFGVSRLQDESTEEGVEFVDCTKGYN